MTAYMRRACFAALVLALGPLGVRAESVNKQPLIVHDPVTWSVRGQALTLKAKVVDTDTGIEDVTLYYALFRDAAPFRVPMRATGLDFYLGTIEANLLSGVDSISYYIEAQDKDGALAETPWYTVEFRKPDKNSVPPGPGPAPAIPPDGGAEGGRSSAMTVGIIAGGAAAVVGGALLLSDSGGGGGGGDDTDTNSTVTAEGTYVGTVTTCLTLSGASPSCESHSATIVIDSRGVVFSETLREGQQLTDNLSGNNFILSATVENEGGVTLGNINYNGTVLTDRIVGSITGSAQTPSGSGSYSGSFSANKQ